MLCLRAYYAKYLAMLVFVGTLGTLSQHEFAFGFCDSIGSLAARDPCSSSTLDIIVIIKGDYKDPRYALTIRG